VGCTRLDNLAYVCICCHSNIHAQTLVIEPDADGGWKWIPKAEDLRRKVQEELADIRCAPQILSVASPGDSGIAEDSLDEQAVADSVSALHPLGFTTPEARCRIRAATRRLGSGASSADLIREAFRSGNRAGVSG